MNRREILIGAGSVAAVSTGVIAFGAGSAGAESHGSFDLDGDPTVESSDGSVEFVALTDGNTEVSWQNYDEAEITHVRTLKDVTVSEDGGDSEAETYEDVAGTEVVAADETGSSGSYELGEYAGITIYEGEGYDGDHAAPPVHNPITGDVFDVGTDGETREFTVTVAVTYELYDGPEAEEPVDTTEASDEFTLSVTNLEATATVGGHATADAE